MTRETRLQKYLDTQLKGYALSVELRTCILNYALRLLRKGDTPKYCAEAAIAMFDGEISHEAEESL